jgi:hypothetical protein
VDFVAVKVLTGDRTKCVGLIFAISVASMLMVHQVSIFARIMWRTTSQIQDVRDAEIWVMDPMPLPRTSCRIAMVTSSVLGQARIPRPRSTAE